MTSNQVSETDPKKEKRGELIAVCSAKGGVGRTMIAVNLAVALCKKNIQISILDGDYQFGDVSLAMDIQSTFTIKDVIEEMDSLDEYTLASFLNHHQSGVKVLAAPDRPEFSELITPDISNKIGDLLLSQHDYLIVDTGVGLQEHTLNCIEKADQILIVTNLEMATLKNTKAMLDTLKTLGLRDKVRVIVNRATIECVIQASDVASILGEEEPPILIPCNLQVAIQSLNVGIPFVMNQGKTDIAKAIYKMAEQLSSRREISLFKPKTPSFFKSIFRKTKRLKERTE